MQMLNFTNNCYLKEENKIHMTKNAIFWIREDFRIEHNPALSFASQNHDNVIGLFIYNKALNNGIKRYLKGPPIKPVFRKYN